MTSLHIAVTYNGETLTRRLLEMGHDPNVIETKLNTPLFAAVKTGSRSIAKLLLDHNARIDLANHTGLTPLHAAAFGGSLDLLELLLSYEGDSNCQTAGGTTPLLCAVMKNNLEATCLLLKHGVDPNKANKEGLSPLYVSVQNENMSIMSLLLENGADPNAITKLKLKKVDPASLSLPASIAIKQSGNESRVHDESIIMLVGNDCPDPHVKHTPISLAVSMGFEDGLDLLLSACGDTIPADPEQDGNNILHYAIALRNDQILLRLIARGAEGLRHLTNNQGETPLHTAAQVGNFMATSMLVQGGCDINKRDHNGLTPLIVALLHEQYGIASLLLDYGVDEAITDEYAYGQWDGKFAIVHQGPRDPSGENIRERLPRLSELLPQLRKAKDSI